MTRSKTVNSGMGRGTHSKAYSDAPEIVHWSDNEVASFGATKLAPDWKWYSDGTDFIGLGAASVALKLQPNADAVNYLTLSTTSGVVGFAMPRGDVVIGYTTDAAVTTGFGITGPVTLDASRTSVSIFGMAQSTITAAAVYTVDNAATFYIADAPVAGGSAVITNPWSVYIAAGANYFGGPVTFADTTFTLASGTDIVSAGAVNFKVSGDNDDYFTITTASHVVTLTATGSTFSIASITDFTSAVTMGSTLGTTGLITASGGIAINDDSSLANTKNLSLYATAAEYVTLDGDGYQGMAMLSDVAAPDITIRGFSAFATASTNKDGGDLIFQPGVNETGGTGADGNLLLKDADGNTELTVATAGVTIANSLTCSSGATFGGAELVVGASNVLHLGASGGTPGNATNSGDVYVKQILEVDGAAHCHASLNVTDNLTCSNTIINSILSMGAGGRIYTTDAANAVARIVRVNAGNSTGDNESGSIGIAGGDYAGTKFAPVVVYHLNGGTIAQFSAEFTGQSNPIFAVFGSTSAAVHTKHRIAIDYLGINSTAFTMASDIVTHDLTIRAVSAYASATSNKNGGNIILQPGDRETGATGIKGAVLFQDPNDGKGALWREYHITANSVNPGGSGATLVIGGVSSATEYYLLDATTEYLYFSADIHDDWDGDSDVVVQVWVALNNNETADDDIKAEIIAEYYGDHDDMDTGKTQTRQVDHDIVNDNSAGDVHVITFVLDEDLTSHNIDLEDVLNLRFRCYALGGAGEVADVRFLDAHVLYRTKCARAAYSTMPVEG